MKVINLNESQYKRLFEGADEFGNNNQLDVPTSVGGSEAATMIVGGVEGKNGETEFVDTDSKARRKNYLRGAGMKQDDMAKTYPSGWAGMR